MPAPSSTTWTRTVGQERHVDVSLWFALRGRASKPLGWDRREFHAVRWWRIAEVDAADPAQFDPQQGRAIVKLGIR